MESKRRVISLLVDNQSGVLARVSNLFCRRGFNKIGRASCRERVSSPV